MKSLKAILYFVLIFAFVSTSACSSLLSQVMATTAQPGAQPTALPSGAAQPTPQATSQPTPQAAGDQPAVLLFGIGMHIEPFGSVPSSLVGGGEPKPPRQPAPGDKRRPDYNQPAAFQRGVQDIQAIARIVEQHGGKMTVQAQTPFTQAAISSGDTILADLASRGHEIALHFHEDAHLGPDSEKLPVETWCAVMKEEIGLIEQASGVEQVRYWSGGNLYPDLFEAAQCAGLDVNSDWKNPNTQSTSLELTGIHPWRPAGGTDGSDVSLFSQHDPQGAVVFLPEGLYPRGDFASMRRSEAPDGDEKYFEFLEQSLLDSLAASQAGQVNVFHFTVHPGEFRGDPQQDSNSFSVIERFLSEVVDPLVASGQVRWATFAEMADAYQAWERGELGALPVSPTAQPIPPSVSSAGYMTFVINVHDWVHSGESADTLLALVDLFERYGVRGDFYFTAPVVEAYAKERPDLIERLKNSDMTISYHVRPPHPLYSGFDQRLKDLDDASLRQAILDYETYGLDLATGDLDRSRPSGYTYVAQVFGRKPVVASAPGSDPRIRRTALAVYAELGAQMMVQYHEEGTDPLKPFVYNQGLLVRPSDFSITRATRVDGSDNFWWNFMSAPDAERYNPTRMLQEALADWQQAGNARAPFITALIHENNFYRSGPEGWTSIYYSLEKNKKSEPLAPPYNLDAPDPSRLRRAADQQATWAAYEELVAYAAAHLNVVTSLDILQLAQEN
ncbi:MAG: PT domain-containing protein [Chloroflexota bacterium]